MRLAERARRTRARRTGGLETPTAEGAPAVAPQIPVDGGAPEPARPADRSDGAGAHAGRTISPEAGGTRLLAGDVRTALFLLNEARYRTLERMFGMGKTEANLLTAVIALAAADTADHFISGLTPPRAGDVALGLGGSRALFQEIAGPSARETPLFASLFTLAVLGGTARPAISWSARAARSASHEMRVAFHNRYGHLLEPDHQRGGTDPAGQGAERTGPTASR